MTEKIAGSTVALICVAWGLFLAFAKAAGYMDWPIFWFGEAVVVLCLGVIGLFLLRDKEVD
jgi:hypothetical protein